MFKAAYHAVADDSPPARQERTAVLLDWVVALYALLPAASLTYLVRLLRTGVPHLEAEIGQACRNAKTRYSHAEVEAQTWFWPVDENPRSSKYAPDERLRFLAPFDPVV